MCLSKAASSFRQAKGKVLTERPLDFDAIERDDVVYASDATSRASLVPDEPALDSLFVSINPNMLKQKEEVELASEEELKKKPEKKKRRKGKKKSEKSD